MKFSLLTEITFILILLLIQPVFSIREYSIGVSPPTLNLGNITTGTRIVHFYIITVSDEPLLVYLEPTEALLDFFDKPGYKNLLYNYSEERVASWVEPLSNPVELKPSNYSKFGTNIKGWRDVAFLLNVPENAEPGYHLVRIRPKPYVFETAGGRVGVQIATVTPVNVLFNIEGTAIREGKILDITGDYVNNNLRVYVHFLNTGTVTMSARADKIEVYDNGKLVTSGSSVTTFVKPGEKTVLTAVLPANNLTYGEYKVYADVDYLTGHVEKNSTISFYPVSVVPVVKPAPAGISISLWLVILILIVCIVIIFVLWYIHENV